MEERELLRMEREFYVALGQDSNGINGEEDCRRVGRDEDQYTINGSSGHIDNLIEGETETSRNHTVIAQQELFPDQEQLPFDSGNNRPVHNTPQPRSLPQPKRSIYSVWVPFLVVLIPNITFSGVLLAIVFADKWKFTTDTFAPEEHSDKKYDGYLLVKMSPTRISIITSCSATLAPFLTVAIMSLWKFRTVRYYVRRCPGAVLDSQVEVHQIPQVNLLLSLLGGSLDGFRKYIKKSCPKFPLKRANVAGQSAPTTKPVHLTALVLFTCIFLILSTWSASTVFHSLSDTVSVTDYSKSTAMNSFGRQLVDYCQNFNRSENLCLPCSWNVQDSTLEYPTRTNNWYKIRMNISEDVQVQAIAPGLSMLLPPSQRIPNITDYRATTFGVSGQCKPITHKCNPRRVDDISIRTVFNCSEGFHGINGQPPVVPLNQSFTILDPDTPPLMIKRSSYLQLRFFLDEDLSVAYNPVNYNVSTPGWAIQFGLSSDGPCPTDDQLLTNLHLGVAGRFSLLSTQAGLDLSKDPGLFTELQTAMDFVFECNFEAWNVEYLWARGSVHSYTLIPANSSLLTMYVGTMQYYQQAPQDDAFYDVNTMAVQGNSTAMADTWARLFSTRILSVIGAYTDPRTNTAEQERKTVLVARVHIGSLVFIVSCGAAYVVLICAVAISAFLCLHQDPRLHAYVDDLSFEKQLEKQIAAVRQQHLSNASRVSSGQTTAVADPTTASPPRPRLNPESPHSSSRSGSGIDNTTTGPRTHGSSPEIIRTPPPPPPGFI